MEIYEPAKETQESPCIPIEFHGETVFLTWFNSLRRVFPYNQEFDHVEFIDEADELQATRSKELMKVMEEYNYPILMMGFVDQQTEDWLIKLESTDLEDVEPEDFGNGTEDIFG